MATRWSGRATAKGLCRPTDQRGQGLSDIHPMRRGGANSFVDYLVLAQSFVPSRAATSLRSVETQPLTRRVVHTMESSRTAPPRVVNSRKTKAPSRAVFHEPTNPNKLSHLNRTCEIFL